MIITSTKIKKRRLNFRFEAGTSRGTLKHKDSWYLLLYNKEQLIGVGEASPLKGLSIEPIDEIDNELKKVASSLEGEELPKDMEGVMSLETKVCTKEFPSISFAVETALLDAIYGGKKIIFPTDFIQNHHKIPINGLIWMGESSFMQEQIKEKIAAGFNCIKMKIGAIDFEKEVELLAGIRNKYTTDEMILRVDANGAFKEEDALEKLDKLFGLGIHSIEQPIKAGQTKFMAELCQSSPLPIALDEELIGVFEPDEKRKLLESIKPQYIILKPSLIGGIASTLEWISIAEKLNIGWWMTSMLESNIGLNAICQLADYLKVKIHQGLGTGQLYHNNIDSPLTIENGHIFYDQNKSWEDI